MYLPLNVPSTIAGYTRACYSGGIDSASIVRVENEPLSFLHRARSHARQVGFRVRWMSRLPWRRQEKCVITPAEYPLEASCEA